MPFAIFFIRSQVQEVTVGRKYSSSQPSERSPIVDYNNIIMIPNSPSVL